MIIITGGAGFIGSNLVKGLNDAGFSELLVVDDLTDGTPLEIGAGQSFEFPVGSWTVSNSGAGDAAPENGPLTHAVYLSDQPEIFLEDGQLDETVDLIGPIGSVLHLPQFIPGVSEQIFPAGGLATFGTPTPLSVTIPASTTPGSYHLVLWIDDGQEISDDLYVRVFVTKLRM